MVEDEMKWVTFNRCWGDKKCLQTFSWETCSEVI